MSSRQSKLILSVHHIIMHQGPLVQGLKTLEGTALSLTLTEHCVPAAEQGPFLIMGTAATLRHTLRRPLARCSSS